MKSQTNHLPKIELFSKGNEEELKFTISNVNVSIANALRRIILSDIPIVVFRVSPSDKNKCTILTNTTDLNNEVIKHRLSCIPIHIKDVSEFPIKNYRMELNVQNNTDTNMMVTTQHFTIQDLVSGKPLPSDKVKEIFPANELTGDYIDFVRLKSKPSDEIQGKMIHLTCDFDIGNAKEDGAYNVVSTCSYGNTIDETEQEKQIQQLKQKWKDEGKSKEEIDFEVQNWKLLEGKRVFKKNSFDFTIQSIGIYSNFEIVSLASGIMIDKLNDLDTIIEKDELEIKVSENAIKNAFDIMLEHEDYTLGKVIEYFLLLKFYEEKIITYCGFKMLHPHDSYGLLRVAYTDKVDVSFVKGNLKDCIVSAKEVFQKIQKEFERMDSK